MRLIPRRRREPTTADKVADVGLKVATAGTKALAAQRVARHSIRNYRLTKRLVPVAVLGAVTVVVLRKVRGGGSDGGGGGGSQPVPTAPGPTGGTTVPATAGVATGATATSGPAAGSGGVGAGGESGQGVPETPPSGAEVAAAASVAGQADDIPSPAAAADGPVPDALGEQVTDLPPTDLTEGDSAGGEGEGAGQTPTEPELDIDGPNESAPGTHPTEAEKPV